MRLYTKRFCPQGRGLTFGLLEKNIVCDVFVEKPWDQASPGSGLSREGKIPVLALPGHVLEPAVAVREYLNEMYPWPDLVGQTAIVRAETRGWTVWVEEHLGHAHASLFMPKWAWFKFRVMRPDVHETEKTRKTLLGDLAVLEKRLETRAWLGGPFMSWVDLTATGFVSCLDYIGEMPWDKHPKLKIWYMCLKSRPAFQPFLRESLPELTPAAHYAVLDF